MREISDELLKLNKYRNVPKTVSGSKLSNRFSTLKDIGLIEKVADKASYVLTPEGVSISGLFRNVWGLHLIMDDTIQRDGDCQ